MIANNLTNQEVLEMRLEIERLRNQVAELTAERDEAIRNVAYQGNRRQLVERDIDLLMPFMRAIASARSAALEPDGCTLSFKFNDEISGKYVWRVMGDALGVVVEELHAVTDMLMADVEVDDASR